MVIKLQGFNRDGSHMIVFLILSSLKEVCEGILHGDYADSLPLLLHTGVCQILPATSPLLCTIWTVSGLGTDSDIPRDPR